MLTYSWLLLISIHFLLIRKKTFKGMSKIEFKTLLEYATKNPLILFNGKYYEQVDGVAMSSPLGPTLANVFLCHWEELWVKKWKFFEFSGCI